MATTEGLRKTEVRVGIGVIATLSLVLVIVFALRLAGVRFTAEDDWPAPVVSREPFPRKPSGTSEIPSTRSEQPTELEARAGFGPPPYGSSGGPSEWPGEKVAPQPRPSADTDPPDYVPRLAGLLHQRDPEASSGAPTASPVQEGRRRSMTGDGTPRYESGGRNAFASDRPAPRANAQNDAAARTTTPHSSRAERSLRATKQRTDDPFPTQTSVAKSVPTPDAASNQGDRYTRRPLPEAHVPHKDPDRQRAESPGAPTRPRSAADDGAGRERRVPAILRTEKTSSAEAEPQTGAHPLRPYTVQRGDTLFDIARAELGDGSRWPEIFRLNRETLKDNYNHLLPGTQLNVPGGNDHAVSLKREPIRIIR